MWRTKSPAGIYVFVAKRRQNMANFKTSIDMRAMIEGWEGSVLTAYRDPVGILTIGYGHTGPDVTEGQTITKEEADETLANDLGKFEDGVNAAVDTAPTTQGQFDAMVSLSFNIGLGNFRKSTVLRKHLESDYTPAADAFLLWNKAGGRVLPGLVKRREGERGVYLSDSPT
jgi:lysozyme